MKLLALNVMSGGFPAYEEYTEHPPRLPLLQELLEEEKPDVVGFVDTYLWRSLFTDEQLNELFGYEYVHCVDMDDTRVDPRIGVTALSRVPGTTFEVLRLDNRNCVKILVPDDGNTITIYATYLDDISEDTRMKQAQVLLADAPDTHAVIMGDLNTHIRKEHDENAAGHARFEREAPERYAKYKPTIDAAMSHQVMDAIEAAGFIDSLPTFAPTALTETHPVARGGPDVRVDFILHTADLKASDSQVLTSKLAHTASDHLPIVSTIETK